MAKTTEMRIDRPLDMLNNLKDKVVCVKLKDSLDEFDCFLIAFDIHLNLVVELDNDSNKKMFIPGHMVHSVKA